MQTYQQTFAAPQTWRLDVSGRYFTVLACRSPLNVRLYKKNEKLNRGDMSNMMIGLEVGPLAAGPDDIAFDRIEIDVQADTVLVGIGDGSVRFRAATQDQATNHVSVTAAVNTALTCTLPVPGAGLFHYIVRIELVKLYSIIGVAAGAGVIITSTNLPGNPAWTTEQLASPAGTTAKVISEERSTPLKSSAPNVATTLVAPAELETIWRWNVSYFTGP